MKRILLTSAGFENRVIENQFLDMVDKPACELKALWIPTAAIDAGAKAVLPKCMDDLLNAGIRKENIAVYDLDYRMEYHNLQQYDTIYVCGGDSRYLLDKMNEMGFRDLLERYVTEDGVYIGVSAGSCICSADYEDGIGWLPYGLDVHCEKGDMQGRISFKDCQRIKLTDNQAIIFYQNEIFILE